MKARGVSVKERILLPFQRGREGPMKPSIPCQCFDALPIEPSHTGKTADTAAENPPTGRPLLGPSNPVVEKRLVAGICKAGQMTKSDMVPRLWGRGCLYTHRYVVREVFDLCSDRCALGGSRVTPFGRIEAGQNAGSQWTPKKLFKRQQQGGNHLRSKKYMRAHIPDWSPLSHRQRKNIQKNYKDTSKVSVFVGFLPFAAGKKPKTLNLGFL